MFEFFVTKGRKKTQNSTETVLNAIVNYTDLMC